MTAIAAPINLYERLRGPGPSTSAADPAWLRTQRQLGLSQFSLLGLPSTDLEEWRLTNVSSLATAEFDAPVSPASAGAELIAKFSLGKDRLAAQLVFIDGRFAPEHSHIPAIAGLTVGSLAAAVQKPNPKLEGHLTRHAPIHDQSFTALNTASFADGAFVHVAPGAIIAQPIHLLFLSTGSSAVHPRTLVVADENSQLALVETYAGLENSKYFTNAVTEISVAPSARIDHCKMQQEGRAAWHIAAMHVTLGRQSVFVSHAASLGAKLGRNDLTCILGGEHAEATLNGLVIIGRDQHIDNHTLLDHAMPNCPSHELYKHVLADNAAAVFKGKILVRQDAQKTNAKQTSKSLLLSNDAVMDSQPALEIYADDVKCTHGSTTGPLDEEMAFYLRSRGVSLEAARHLLTYAFAADITRRIKVGPVRERLENIMAAQHGLPQDLRITDLAESYVPMM